MPTKIETGISTNLDSFEAGKDAARAVYYRLNRQAPDILIVFVSCIYNQRAVLEGIRSVIDEVPMVGCSSAGSITNYGSFRYSVGVCGILSDTIRFSSGAGHSISKNPRLAGKDAAIQASNLKNAVKQLYIMFSDCLSGNMTDLLRGSQEALGTSFPIIGGSASDDLEFHKVYQYLNYRIYTEHIVGLLISGNIKIGIGQSHGWQPIGAIHTVSRARSNIIKEIDRKKAVEFYEEYLGKSYNELETEGIAGLGASYPVGMRIQKTEDYLIRAPLKIEEIGSLMLSAEIPERQDINLMIGDKKLLLEAAEKACMDALKAVKKSNIKFALIFSDIGRLQLLKQDSQMETEIIKQTIGKDVPFFGCYVCGEYAPIGLQEYKGQSYFHNQAISVTLISE